MKKWIPKDYKHDHIFIILKTIIFLKSIVFKNNVNAIKYTKRDDTENKQMNR